MKILSREFYRVRHSAKQLFPAVRGSGCGQEGGGKAAAMSSIWVAASVAEDGSGLSIVG